MERLVLLRINQLRKFITNYMATNTANVHIIDISIQGIIILVKFFHRRRDGARRREQPGQSCITQSALSHKAEISMKKMHYTSKNKVTLVKGLSDP